MSDTARTDLIDHACRVLDFEGGALYDASSDPGALGLDLWSAHGDWLLLADRMQADRVFFVGDDPVIVFTSLESDATEQDLVDAYRRAWSLSRARCLFIARGGELRVYALTSPPKIDRAGKARIKPIEIVERAADISSTLQRFRRDRVEAGATFESSEFRSPRGRADHRLIADVTVATDALKDAGLDQATAHTLIERVILVRYLEDRRIVVPDYIYSIAAQRPEWRARLHASAEVPNYGADSTFVRCLTDLELTYAVFERLAHDFNGDLFVTEEPERLNVRQAHLTLIKSLLEGTASASQQSLFLWAYDFGVVPTSLISTMYEVFYQQDVVGKLTGTHYTPVELVEFTLSETLTDRVLRRSPKVCDPACGSGVFLVEAFRTIVRFESARLGRQLTPPELKSILLDRIAGIDLNREAVRLAAFSLYLAYLNYQTPQDIREAGPLPRLICRSTADRCVLAVSDAFAPTVSEAPEEATIPWPNGAFDVLLANPPWTEPKANQTGLPDEWGKRRDREVGDRNRSQLFLWRALDLLAADGVATMLVAASAFVAARDTSRAFRRAWLGSVSLTHIVNFAQVRRQFFTKAVAPFFMVSFKPRLEQSPHQLVVYETAVPSAAFSNTRSMSFARLDRRVVAQRSLEEHDYLWKVYAWGGHRDEALLARLNMERRRIRDALPAEGPGAGYGYQWGSDTPSPALKELQSLKTFAPWGRLKETDFEPAPAGTKRQPDERLYKGLRVLVRRGVTEPFGPYARVVEEPLSFRHQIYCLPMESAEPWKARVVAGTLLSSLGRYQLFMTSSAWGLWYDQVYLNEVLDVPARLREGDIATDRIVRAVDRLREVDIEPLGTLFAADDGPSVLSAVLRELDEAVFDLFELGADERDLVREFWARYTDHLPPLEPSRTGLRQGVESPTGGDAVSRYLDTFLGQWNDILRARSARLSWTVADDAEAPVTAAIFHVIPAGGDPPEETYRASRWRDALKSFGNASDPTRTDTERLYREGLIRAVSMDGILIVKRNEARLWTRSAARDDAEATVLQATRLRAS